MTTPEQMDWNNLGFGYTDTGKRYRAYYHNGAWEKGRHYRRCHHYHE